MAPNKEVSEQKLKCQAYERLYALGKPTICQYIMHYLSLPWQLLFATIPPTNYIDGL